MKHVTCHYNNKYIYASLRTGLNKNRFGPYTIVAWTAQFVYLHIALNAMIYLLKTRILQSWYHHRELFTFTNKLDQNTMVTASAITYNYNISNDLCE